MTTSPALSLPHKVPELLAPAGGREQFFAALNAGADAVYLGLKAFNARARAENFTPDDLRELVPLAHDYGMQVLVTMNVLIKDAELPTLLSTLSVLEELEVDAIIVQDLAVAALVRAHFPKLRLHASTQMAVHNLAGVLKAHELGFRRVVLARELTATELRQIRAQLPPDGVEIEAFCHGSLCYSYSGLCFFSGADDARSGNRGECAYTCRQPYKIVSEPGHGFLFSMRDLDTSKHLDLLVKAGVDTLKIEGRKKDAQYVSSVVRLYRERLDDLFGYPTLRASAPKAAAKLLRDREHTVEDDLALSFQRQTTAFFLKNRYHENVIDLDSPSHAGVLLGRVLSVQSGWMKVKIASSVERFDGLRLVPKDQHDSGDEAGVRLSHALPQDGADVQRDPAAMLRRYDNKYTEFSLRELRAHGQRAATAAPGTTIDIELPNGAAPRSGDLVFKIRSADLKRRVTQLTAAPHDAKLKQVRLIEVQLAATEHAGRLTLTATATKLEQVIAQTKIELPAAKAKGAAALAADAAGLFQTLGDFGLRASAVTFTGEADWFVPRSSLKQLKQQLGAQARPAYEAFIAERLAQAHVALNAERPAQAHAALNAGRPAQVHAALNAERPAQAHAALNAERPAQAHAALNAGRPPVPPANILTATAATLADATPTTAPSNIPASAATPSPAAAAAATPSPSAAPAAAPSPSAMPAAVYAIKSDRLETLEHAITYAKAHSSFALHELVFEPKRAFLHELNPSSLAASLAALQQRSGQPLRLAIPTVIRAWDEPLLKRWAQAAAGAGITRFEVGNLGAFELLASWGLPLAQLDLASDFTLYALNAVASRFWHRQGISQVCLSIEDDADNLASHLGRLTAAERALMQVVIFKDTPLFIAEACSLTALHGGCPTSQVCGYRTLEVENPKGERFYVAHEACKSIVYGHEAYSLTGQQDLLRKLGVRRFRVDFLTRPYGEEQVHKVLAGAQAHQTLPATHSANFKRTLL